MDQPSGEEVKFVCDMCDKKKTFSTKNNLSRHKKEVHDIPGLKLYKCKLCDNVFKRKSDRRKHRRNVYKKNPVYVRNPNFSDISDTDFDF